MIGSEDVNVTVHDSTWALLNDADDPVTDVYVNLHSLLLMQFHIQKSTSHTIDFESILDLSIR